jgi:nucleoid DNA-binding protein
MVKPLQGTSDPIIFREIDKHGACPVQHMKGLRHMATKTAKTTKPVKTVKAKITAATKVRTKGSIYKDIATTTELSRKQVVSVFDTLTEMMKADLGKKGCGTFNLFGLAKMRTVNKPATKTRKGKNPFTGMEITIKAKPASRKVRIRAMKGLNESV